MERTSLLFEVLFFVLQQNFAHFPAEKDLMEFWVTNFHRRMKFEFRNEYDISKIGEFGHGGALTRKFCNFF